MFIYGNTYSTPNTYSLPNIHHVKVYVIQFRHHIYDYKHTYSICTTYTQYILIGVYAPQNMNSYHILLA